VEGQLRAAGVAPVDLAAALRAEAERMCDVGGSDDWLTLGHTGPVAARAAELVPTLGTDAFDDRW
jgi:hypothetical protein